MRPPPREEGRIKIMFGSGCDFVQADMVNGPAGPELYKASRSAKAIKHLTDEEDNDKPEY